ncbi:hypothetical protein F8388_002518 [Cannabis sativa]|uniref:Uncharacterized protein n=1 Tax=Cannabis sativa TaxID=3483 RepID=A0A7J6DUV8_CANSA|nr:hypothetical protein F8388_002518 [Cannabis sativa]
MTEALTKPNCLHTLVIRLQSNFAFIRKNTSRSCTKTRLQRAFFARDSPIPDNSKRGASWGVGGNDKVCVVVNPLTPLAKSLDLDLYSQNKAEKGKSNQSYPLILSRQNPHSSILGAHLRSRLLTPTLTSILKEKKKEFICCGSLDFNRTIINKLCYGGPYFLWPHGSSSNGTENPNKAQELCRRRRLEKSWPTLLHFRPVNLVCGISDCFPLKSNNGTRSMASVTAGITVRNSL